MPVDDSCRRGGRGAGAMARRAWACRRAASWTRVAPLVAVIGMGLAARPSLAKGELYVKKDSLQQTMLDVRARLRDWQAAQLGAWRAVKASPWHGVTLGGQKLDGADLSKPGAPPASAAKTALPQWNPWSGDGSGGFFSVEALPADFLATTIQAERPVTLTLELSRYEWFGGFAYRPQPSGAGVQASDALVWLNGRQVELRNKLEGYQRVPVAKRRGWHERYAWHDAVLVDLALQRGENRLVVTLHKPPRMRWFNSVRLVPRPAPALWPMIENDFPRSGNRLLEQVAAQWFDAESGWFAQVGSVQLERQFLEDLTKKLGADGEAVRRRLDELVKAQAAPSDARCLDLCVAAAELHAALGQADALRAAVEELRAAYGQGYPGERLLGRIADLRGRLLVADRLDPAHDQTRRLLAEMDGLKREALVASNPLLAGKKLLLVKRYSYDSDHYYDEHNSGISRFGGGLYTLSLGDGAVAEIAPQLRAGVVDRYDLSFDGRRIVFGYKPPKPEGFRLFEIGVDGRGLRQLTFPPGDESQRIATYSMISRDDLQKNPARYGHWTDDKHPCYLPDGRIVFTSTRIGRFEEYHNPPSRSLWAMNPDGSDLRPLTHTIIFDNEPEVLADGRIVFIRSDNFFDRGKVETLLHAVHPDGSEGYTEFGLDNGPEYGGRLRAYLCGSPAPLADGRLAFLSGPGITVGRLGYPAGNLQHFSVAAGDVAALPDGRLLCTTAVSVPREIRQGREKKTIQELRYEKIAVLDPDSQPPALTVLYQSSGQALHSPVYLGARPRPPRLATKVHADRERDPQATGVLFCQNARFTQQTTAGWPHVRAIRVLAGTGLTVRSSHSYIVHAGSQVTELGTVPLAPDGSFAVEVPADTPIALQAVDAEGRSELNEMSWIYVRPGEQRGCIGCHHDRQAAPLLQGGLPLALRTRPLKLLRGGQSHQFRGNNAAVTGLMELQFDRYREVAGINRYEGDGAAHLTVPVSKQVGPPAPRIVPTGADQVAVLVAQLSGDDLPSRISAAQRLALYRDPVAAPALAECLAGSPRELRVAAALALAVCGTRDSVPPLLDVLTDRDPLVAQAAAVALENLTGHAEEFNAFVPEARDRRAEDWRQWIADHPWERIERELVTRLDDPDRDAVRRAAAALGHTGSQSACAPLRRCVQTHRDTNPYPEWKKAHQVDGTRFNSLSEANPRTLQAVTRSLGYLRDADAVPLLAETLSQHDHPDTGNLFLAEAAVEALGRIGTPEAEAALVEACAALDDYPKYTLWYGDHPALMACHASPVHYFLVEALDRIGSTRAQGILPHLIRSLPVDQDRALLLGNDDCEVLTGRVIRRQGAEAAVAETCLAVLGDEQAARDAAIEQAISATHRCWGGHPGPEIRAAQVLSLACRNADYAPRIFAAFDRYRAQPVAIERVFDKGIPVVQELPLRHWVCFYLARALGNLADPESAELLVAVLEQSPPEAATGHPDPLGPGVLFLHNDLTPCWRAAVAWALGRIGDRRAVPVLLAVVGNLQNAPDTRHTAAEALARIADPASAGAIAALADGYPEESTRRALVEAWTRCR